MNASPKPRPPRGAPVAAAAPWGAGGFCTPNFDLASSSDNAHFDMAVAPTAFRVAGAFMIAAFIILGAETQESKEMLDWV